MAMAMAAAAALLVLVVIAAPAAFAVQHTVGGSSGWAQSVNYTAWAAGEKFTVGDTLLFQYGSSHSVDVVTQSDYSNCNSGNALNSYTGGSSVVNLGTAGPMYFLCPTAGHCQGGMKLAVTVMAASGSPTATPSPPGTPTTYTSPPPPPPPPTSGAAGNFGSKNYVVLGLSLLVVAVIAFMG